MESVLARYNLTAKDCNVKISEHHLQDISRKFCEKWRSLPIHLGLNPIVTKDIDRSQLEESEKRHSFFSKWEEEKGSEATYKKLTFSLLLINCRKDAECVCKLLVKSRANPSPPSSSSSGSEAKSRAGK